MPLPRGKTIQRPVVRRLWNGRASEDREEWMEEVKVHCERCHDDKDETSQMQEDRIQQRRRGSGLEAWTGRMMEITVGKVLRARGNLMKNKGNGPSDCLLTEMYEVTHWFEKRVTGKCRAPASWTVLRVVFLKKLDAKLENGIR